MTASRYMSNGSDFGLLGFVALCSLGDGNIDSHFKDTQYHKLKDHVLNTTIMVM
jgi:hypothetical protein